MRNQPNITTSFAGLQAEDALLRLMKVMPEGWVVYILECDDGSLYTGVSNDLSRRLKTHLDGRGARYTKSHQPTKLVYVEPAQNHSLALKREAAIKQLPREQKLKLIGALARFS